MFIEIILSDFAVEYLVHNVNNYAGNLFFVQEPNEETFPIRNAPFTPLLEGEFNKDKKLGFVYGKGSGCAFIRKEALEKTLAFAEKKHLRVNCCEDLLLIMKQLKFKIKQVDYVDLDFQNIKSEKIHPTFANLGIPYEALPDDELNEYLNTYIRQGGIKELEYGNTDAAQRFVRRMNNISHRD